MAHFAEKSTPNEDTTNRFQLGKLTVPHLVKHLPEFCGSESSLQFPQQLNTGPVPSQINPVHHPAMSYLREIQFKIALPPSPMSPKRTLSRISKEILYEFLRICCNLRQNKCDGPQCAVSV